MHSALLSTKAVTQLTYGHKDIIYLVVGFRRCLHEQEASGPCKLFSLLGGDKHSYSLSPHWGCLFSYRGRSWQVRNCTGTLGVLLGHIPVPLVRGEEQVWELAPGTHLSSDFSLSSKIHLVAYQSNDNFIRKEFLLQVPQPQLCSVECFLER